MPSKLTPIFTSVVLVLGATLSISTFTQPANAFEAQPIELGFLAGIDDPAQFQDDALNIIDPAGIFLTAEDDASPQRGQDKVLVIKNPQKIQLPAMLASH